MYNHQPTEVFFASFFALFCSADCSAIRRINRVEERANLLVDLVVVRRDQGLPQEDTKELRIETSMDRLIYGSQIFGGDPGPLLNFRGFYND